MDVDELRTDTLSLSADIAKYVLSDSGPPIVSRVGRLCNAMNDMLLEISANKRVLTVRKYMTEYYDSHPVESERDRLNLYVATADEALRSDFNPDVDEINWGGIVAILYLAKFWFQLLGCMDDDAVRFVGAYIGGKCGSWIQSRGGWDDFIVFAYPAGQNDASQASQSASSTLGTLFVVGACLAMLTHSMIHCL